MATGIPLSRASQLLPFLDLLDRHGARTELALERNKLPLGLREDPNVMIGAGAMSRFVGDTARREGITDFGWCAASLTQIPVLSREIVRSQTLFQALETICDLGIRESSNVGLWIEEGNGSVRFCFRPSVEIGYEGSDEMAKMQTAVALSVVRLFAGPDWTPPDCGLAVRSELGPVVREALGDARIRRESDHSWLRVPRSILSLPLRAPFRGATSPGWATDPALDLVGSLVQAVRPYVGRRMPSIQDAADLAGTSARSLQRRLAREDSSYRDVTQRAKLEVAQGLLAQRDGKIVEVAYELGFSDPAHFTRFFRSSTGVTPREYRRSALRGRA